MLLATVNPEAAASIGNVQKVGVGNRVVYHARAGYMRDKRTSFPADVLRQHEDGSLDLLVHMEREDIAQEEHVQFRSHNQPYHCWSPVEDVPGVTGDQSDLQAIVEEALAPLLARIAAIENRPKPGRPPKAKAE